MDDDILDDTQFPPMPPLSSVKVTAITETELAALRAALAQTQAERDSYRRRALVLTAKLKRDRLAANDCIDDAITEKQMAEAYIDDLKKERDAATARAEKAEVWAENARSLLLKAVEYIESVDATYSVANGKRINNDWYIGAKSALAGPEGGER